MGGNYFLQRRWPFTVERDLPGSPRHAWRFWSDHQLKRRWNGCHPDWTVLEAEVSRLPVDLPASQAGFRPTPE